MSDKPYVVGKIEFSQEQAKALQASGPLIHVFPEREAYRKGFAAGVKAMRDAAAKDAKLLKQVGDGPTRGWETVFDWIRCLSDPEPPQ